MRQAGPVCVEALGEWLFGMYLVTELVEEQEAKMERHEAESLLKTSVGNPAASFRDGQWEAIDALVRQE